MFEWPARSCLVILTNWKAQCVILGVLRGSSSANRRYGDVYGIGHVWTRPWAKLICADPAVGFLPDQHVGDQHWSEVFYDLIMREKRMERLHWKGGWVQVFLWEACNLCQSLFCSSVMKAASAINESIKL